MFRNINVGNSVQEYIEQPLVPDDAFSYKIIWKTGEKGGILKVTAILSDGSVVYDTGTISENGVATYVLASSMYRLSGSMELRLSVVSGKSVLTDRILHFTVLESAGEDVSQAESKYLALDTLLIKVNNTLNGAESHIRNSENPHSVTKAQLGLSDVDNTKDLDKPVSIPVKNAIDSTYPVAKIKVNNSKKVVLPALKGGVPLKSLCIGTVSSTEKINATSEISIILKSKVKADPGNIKNWVPYAQTKTSDGIIRRFAYFDMTEFAKDSENKGLKLWVNYDFYDVKAESLRIYVLKKNTIPFEYENLTNFLIGKDNVESKGNNILIDFSLLENAEDYSKYLSDEYILVLACASQTFISSSASNQTLQYEFFKMWHSRFKYFQITEEEVTPDYCMGESSKAKELTVNTNKTSYFHKIFNSEELKDFFLENSGTAELIINTSDEYAPPTDVYVEFYQDPVLIHQKLKAEINNLILTNTAAIVANGGSE